MNLGPHHRHAFQFGYVTSDLAAAQAQIARLYGVGAWVSFPVDREVIYRGQPARFTIDVALANFGDRQIELIVPHGGSRDFYLDGIDLDRQLMHFHHIAMLVVGPESEWHTLKRELADAGRPFTLYSDEDTIINFGYLDTRAEWGHYTEYHWRHPEGEASFREMAEASVRPA
ncbi:MULTISPECIES: VOC family protein [unclassified Sphingobium]|uniref:VOC family protein n=1 Tax=unclassified Sphingobium TaxID=2611147 RepID=UPI0035A70F55